jgi:nucleoside 2-deoxyribosyltransferase
VEECFIVFQMSADASWVENFGFDGKYTTWFEPDLNQGHSTMETTCDTASLSATPRVYLAGFDVFRADAVAHGERLKALCRERGMSGLYPLDGQVPSDLDPLSKAQWICRANLDLIRGADVVMANLDDFRGAGEPDSGTAFEVGFAVALGKPVWGYTTEERTLVERVAVRRDDSVSFCDRGYIVEDFGLSMNLMIACTARIIVGGPGTCLDAIAKETLRFGRG